MCLPLKPFKIELEWEYAGLQCAVVQAREACHRCGYVRLPPTHPDYGKSYDEVDVDVHGGLTFAEFEECLDHADGIGYWLGFDCCHAGDASTDPHFDKAQAEEPGTIHLLEMYEKFPIHDEHYWTLPDVKAETERLAEQLAGMLCP